MERVIITRHLVGLLFMQVCCVKDATDKEILEVCNRQNPSGTSGGWQNVIRETGGEYQPNQRPVQCTDHEDRIHMLAVC